MTFAACLALSAGSAPVPAQSTGMGFDPGHNIISEMCIIEILRDGTFGVRPNLKVLDSRNYGGSSAEVRVTSRKFGAGSNPGARFRITLEPPSTFVTAPAGGNANLNWRTWFSGTSVSNGVDFNLRNGMNGRRLPRTGTSVTLITGHLRARKTSGIFPAGTYRAEAVFRCE